jgi:hypothetical protein
MVVRPQAYKSENRSGFDRAKEVGWHRGATPLLLYRDRASRDHASCSRTRCRNSSDTLNKTFNNTTSSGVFGEYEVKPVAGC